MEDLRTMWFGAKPRSSFAHRRLSTTRDGPYCQPTGASPSWGVRLSNFDDGVSRNRVASEAANATDCRCVRASF
jgi:hypothetical protein